ncbi:hydantoinase/oxoprolinase family protein [Pseudoflavonifractor phocaeensis]|nr:hydantoinase/oxoprolinase family protein [Pseudoflavonifractor phocaeensis]
MSYMIGVDVGGTFTDFSLFDTQTGALTHYKRSSTPEDPSKAIMGGIQEILAEQQIDPKDVSYLAHGTTVATNALIEKKGARMGLITTEGFKDLMEIGWQRRPSLYDLRRPKPENLIPAGMKQEVKERILHDGSVLTPLDEDSVRNAVRYLKAMGAQTIAVCTLFSFLNPAHEDRIKEIIDEEYPGVYVSASHDLVAEFREYSRMSTTMLNAYLGPVMKEYVHNFERSVQETGIQVAPYVTQSNGSIISIAETVDCPIKTAVSGPSAGVIGAIYIGKQCGLDKIITFDMGGTSIDVSLIENGKAQLSNDRTVEGYPARIPMIDIVTVGAGGGSIARIDEGGALKVGPRSAGATPGPACYMRGGELPCVTDANILLGKLNSEKILGGKMDVDISLAEKAIRTHICEKSDLDLHRAAAGIISVVNSNMVRAIRVVSVERGYDPREFTLMAFGGAGPLHACEVARDMGIRQVLMPPSPGTLCSLGLLMADTKFDLSCSNLTPAQPDSLEKAQKIFQDLLAEGNALLDKEHVAQDKRQYTYTVDCRYMRQNYEIPIQITMPFDKASMDNMIEQFNQEHEHAYGYCNREMPVQMVNFRISAIGVMEKPNLAAVTLQPDAKLPQPMEVRKVLFDREEAFVDTNVYRRSDLKAGVTIQGPAILEQMDSTCVIPPQWQAYTDAYHNIIATYQGGDEE